MKGVRLLERFGEVYIQDLNILKLTKINSPDPGPSREIQHMRRGVPNWRQVQLPVKTETKKSMLKFCNRLE